MTDAVSLKPDLGRFGVWTFGTPKPEQAVEIEKLGYGALWVGGSPAGNLVFVEPILEQTETLQVATGIVNVWTAPADEVAEAYHRIEDAYPGRFLLGIGIGHPEHTEEYRKPYDVLVEYLDALDAAKVPTSRRVVAALGPKVLKLAGAAQRGCASLPDDAGAHRLRPANWSVPTVFLAPEHKVVLTTDADEARDDRPQDRRLLSESEQLPEQLEAARLHRQGRGQARQRPADRRGGRLRRPRRHRQAPQRAPRGRADHVAIQVLGGWDKLMPTLTELAGPLGLKG